MRGRQGTAGQGKRFACGGERRMKRGIVGMAAVVFVATAPGFIPASNEPSGCEADIWRMPRGSIPRQLAAGLLTLGEESFVCEAKETAPSEKPEKAESATSKQKEDEIQEIVDFATAYRKAFSPEGIDTLADYVDDPESRDFQMDLFRLRETFKHGVKGWENVKAIACPMSDGKHWVVSVGGDMIVEGIDVGIPGLNVVLVGRDEAGELKIIVSDFGDSDEAFVKEIRELSMSDEIVEHSNDIAVAFNYLIAERPDVMEWAMETSNAVDEKVAKEAMTLTDEQLKKLNASGEETAETSKKETPPKAGDSYVVEKGDCLWDIAEKQLGDGMRWSGLYEKNKDVIGENPDLLYVGITLQLIE